MGRQQIIESLSDVQLDFLKSWLIDRATAFVKIDKLTGDISVSLGIFKKYIR